MTLKLLVKVLLLVVLPFGAFATLAIAHAGVWVCLQVLFWIFCFTCGLCAGPILCVILTELNEP